MPSAMWSDFGVVPCDSVIPLGPFLAVTPQPIFPRQLSAVPRQQAQPCQVSQRCLHAASSC